MWVFDFVLLFVIKGIISISPKVQTANKIHRNQPKQPRCFVFTSVTACAETFSLLHFGHVIKSALLSHILPHLTLIFNNQQEEKKIEKIKIKCPVCGYEMPERYSQSADCTGVFVRCKGKNCKQEFEIVIKNGKQVK
nr:MAG TPA: cysteine-rich protein [Caudoviricetes sp.]